jgi:hypothetical protein
MDVFVSQRTRGGFQEMRFFSVPVKLRDRCSRLPLVVALGITAVACDSTGGPFGHRQYQGDYYLALLDGAGLPAPLIDDPWYRFEVTEGKLTLNSNQSFSVRLDHRVIQGPDTVSGFTVETGAYIVYGRELRLLFDDGVIVQNVIDLSEIRGMRDGHMWVHRRKSL